MHDCHLINFFHFYYYSHKQVPAARQYIGCWTFLYVLQIESRALNFKESAQSKVGSMDNAQHKPGGGDKKVTYNQSISCSTACLRLKLL